MRVARIAVLWILALSARSAVGTPLSTVAELQALSCCASFCKDVVRTAQCSCCQVANTDEAPLKQVTASVHPACMYLPTRAAPVLCHARLTSLGPVTADATGPPTYLRLRTLQC